MNYTLKTIADLVNGELIGDPEKIISKTSRIEDADQFSLSFISNKKYLHHLESTEAGAIIVSKSIGTEVSGRNLILAEDPYVAFTTALITLFSYKDPNTGIHPWVEPVG